jgi:hypothetical protein
MKFKCKYCEAMLETEWSLLNHQKKTKKCLLKQGVVPKGEFKYIKGYWLHIQLFVKRRII